MDKAIEGLAALPAIALVLWCVVNLIKRPEW
jgi:hypothetical protein